MEPRSETDKATRRLAGHLAAARPQALGALSRYFRDLDEAEEAYQEACLRALKSWPGKGTPRDPVAWLIFVGRNYGLDQRRRRRRLTEFPRQDDLAHKQLSQPSIEDTEMKLVEKLE